VRFRNLLATGLLLLFIGGAAFAQGGPPLVTDDPETPGDGKWEINLATIGSETFQHWDVDALDADINYGWGDHVQLKLDVPLTYAHDSGTGWKSGLGSVNAGVKWRFIDMGDEHGFNLSTYPQYLSGWSGYSKRHGLATNNPEFFLPVEFSTKSGEFEFTAEAGRNFVKREPDEWEAGVIASHSCFSEDVDCLVEVHQTWVPHNSQTLLNFGFHWKLSESLIMLGAIGRDIGADTPDQQRALFYFGFQILR
jgi:hypothetical protein